MTDTAVLLRRGNLAPLVLVNLGVGLHATIWFLASTAMPSAVEELDAAAYLSWATSLYLMTSILGGAMLAPVKARFGARHSMMAAGFIVIAGGVIAGLAPSVGYILAGRAIQGLAEGFLVALSYALVRELFDNALVPRVGGIEAVTWALAVMLGPLLGGWLTELGTWRTAFFGSALLPVPMMILGWIILRNRPHVAATRHRAPMLRLGLLALGVMAIAASDRVGNLAADPIIGHILGAIAVCVGLFLVGATLRLDRRSLPRLFPTAFPGFRHPVSLGLWVMVLMPLAEAAVYVYGPYILQVHRGLAPTVAGYFGAIHALAWSASAMLVAPLARRWQNTAILAGPTFLALGLAGLGFTLADQPLSIIAIAMVLIGLGFGVSYSFLTQRVMAATDPGEEDATSAAIPTLGGLGGAVSAAMAGLIGNAIGLDGPLTAEIVSTASLALFGGGALLALAALCLAVCLLRALRQPAEARA